MMKKQMTELELPTVEMIQILDESGATFCTAVNSP